jgi:hypothetical protein
MLGVLWGLLLVLVAALLLVSAVLATPVQIAFAAARSPGWQLKIVARLLGGLTPEIVLHDSERPKRRRKAPRAKEKKAPGSRRRSGWIPRAMAAAPQLVTGLLEPVHLENLAIDADIGLEDPADTGQLFGMLAAASYALPRPAGMSIVVRPDFSGARAAGKLEVALSCVPILLIPPGVRFAWRVFGPRR